MAFNPDGTLLATSTAGPFWSEFMLFDAKSGEMLFEPLSGHDDAVSVIAFSTDLTIIATGSSDHTIRLWDVASGQPIGSALLGHSGSLQNLVFSADGKVLASASREGSIRIWDIDPESWLVHACKIANRNLTEAEWLAYLGEEPHRKTCPALP
jgi:WD40 repeat protein